MGASKGRYYWRRAGYLLLALVLLGGVGRLIQVAWESRLVGATGPYLQMLGSDGVTVRWISDEPVLGGLYIGDSPDSLELASSEERPATVHELRVEGLVAGRAYYYGIGSSEALGEHGEDYLFHTAPPHGSERPLRLWVQGDPGYARPEALAVSDAALTWMAEHPREGLPAMDLWLTTGDNAYSSGSTQQFHDNLFTPYAALLRQYPYWPIHGNHDARRWSFFRLFTFPTGGELGGVPSGSEHYFSFDYGQLHLIVLDTDGESLAADGKMARWLEGDLAATRQPWVLALLHHPPYTKGSHDSDDLRDSWGRMAEVRQTIVPLLERGGVDLVLSGHSHVYERSHLMGCHYGPSESFNSAVMVLDETSPYEKHGSGTLYAVVGSSAKLGNGTLDHPALPVAMRTRGSLVLEIAGEVLSGDFITADGKVLDHFELHKQGSESSLTCGD